MIIWINIAFNNMTNLKTFLKTLEKTGYPSTSTYATTVAKMIEKFLKDLLYEVGDDKTFEFVENTFSKLGVMSSPGLKIDLSNTVGETGSYIYLIINGFTLAHREDDTLEVWIHYTFGKSQLIHDGEIKTLDDIYEDVGLGEMGEWDDLIKSIEDECINYLFFTTGFIVHFDFQT
jgi:hypothetical protein